MAAATLVLRDIHQPPAPPWWPPAPGWWWLAAGIVLVGLFVFLWHLRRSRRRAVRERMFDATVSSARTPAEQVAAMSELLRRAARQCDPDADRLQGEGWLERLDAGDPAKPFTTGPGRLLLDGAFRPDVEPAQVEAVRPLARARFLRWMGER